VQTQTDTNSMRHMAPAEREGRRGDERREGERKKAKRRDRMTCFDVARMARAAAAAQRHQHNTTASR
jgi:hypothetical protein